MRIRAYFWSPAQGVDWLQLRSDVSLKAKVGLQLAGALGPAPREAGGDASPTRDDVRFDQASTNARHDVASQAAANLRRDARAAMTAGRDPADARPTPMEHALEQPETPRQRRGDEPHPGEPPA